MSYPVEPTQFKEYFFKPEWYERDFFHSPDGIKEFPQHHCKLTYMLSKPYINKTRTAIDIGCRDGEYTRYLQNDFHHVFCFDVRYRRLFAYNADPNKTTHFRCALGNTENKYPREDEFFQKLFGLRFRNCCRFYFYRIIISDEYRWDCYRSFFQ